MIGRQFGYLTVLQRQPSPRTGSYWLCRCTCGLTTVVRGCHLTSGNTRSCGHLRRAVNPNYKHGHARKHHLSPTYRSWRSAIVNCHTPSNHNFQYAGALGIRVCPRWRDSFSCFLEDMGERPPGLCLQRIDRTRDYEPGNCRWATLSEIHSHSRRAVRLKYASREMCISGWCAFLGVNDHAIHTLSRKESISRLDALKRICATTRPDLVNQACP